MARQTRAEGAYPLMLALITVEAPSQESVDAGPQDFCMAWGCSPSKMSC